MRFSSFNFCRLLIILLSLSVGTACQDDREESGDGIYSSFRILLSPSLQLLTRSGCVENQLTNLYSMVFDSNGTLESRQIFETAPSEITFSKLSAGNKTLFILSNIGSNGYQIAPTQLEEVMTLTELRALVLTHSHVMVHAPQRLPMTHFQEFTIPMNNPSITVDLTREVARLVIDNDLSSEGIAAVDSICFRGLSKESTLFEQEGQKVKLDSITVTLQADSLLHTFYILPVLGGQVSYTVFWKDKLGVTRLNQGHITPKLDKNNSYRLKLSTGEIVEIGTPGDLTVTVPPLVGNYFVQDTTVQVVPDGGTFVIGSSSFDSVGIHYSDPWLMDAATTRAVKKKFEFAVSVAPLVDSDEMRTGYITLFNRLDPMKKLRVRVKQQGENRGPKYYVILVGGQSNASGKDLSPFDVRYDEPNSRVFQFGQAGLNMPYPSRFTSASTLSIVPLYCNAQNLDSHLTSSKSMHLSLGKQILPHIPEDYKVLVISASYTGSGFEMTDSEGVYDPIQMRVSGFPKNLPGRYRLMTNKGVIYNMMVDRVKYALSLNKRNRFIGVVWSQGEVDAYGNLNLAYRAFGEFSQAFFDALNQNVPNEQLSGGFAGKHLWYPIDLVPMRKDWHRNAAKPHYATSHVFGGYKVWNPDTYIALPMDVKMNPPSSNDDVHFGQNAFPEVIVPRIVDRMVKNGIFENKAPTLGDTFKRVITTQEALSKTGNINDADIQNNLLVCLPFNDSDSVTANLSLSSVPASIRNQGMSLVEATELIDIQGHPRSRLALSLRSSNGTYMSIQKSDIPAVQSWSASFMLRRTDGKGNFVNRYLLRVPGQNRGLFYHRYGLECEGSYLGIAFQPNDPEYNRYSSVVARLNDADFVRSHSDWIHYSVSYNHVTRACKMYMNGQLTMSKTLVAGQPVPTISSFQLNDPTAGINGQMMDLYIWNREVSAETLFKTYIMSYYGLHK